MTQHLAIGVDPGPVNTGFAYLNIIHTKSGISRISHTTFLRSINELGMESVAKEIVGLVPISARHSNKSMVIERFIPYKGIQTDHAELVNQFIGYLLCLTSFDNLNDYLVRAIDWKSELCKYMYKTHEFRNPSMNFDKKYSIAMAKAICGEIGDITDHEADAICLAYFGFLISNNNEKFKYIRP